MSARDVLARLDELGAAVTRDNDRLVVRSGAVPVPPEVVAAVRTHKPELLRLVAREEDGDGPQAWARELARLDPTYPAADVPANRWGLFLDDAGEFVKEGWAVRAVALGWEPHDLFGCDRIRPHARIDRLGLVWLLHGRPVAAITAGTATMSTARGGHLTYYRRGQIREQVFPWQLPNRRRR
jgi:hypothetical protein